MKVLIVSDTHGRRGELEEIIELEKPFQFLIHCGDVEGDEEYIRQTAGCDCVFVKGNKNLGVIFNGLKGTMIIKVTCGNGDIKYEWVKSK